MRAGRTKSETTRRLKDQRRAPLSMRLTPETRNRLVEEAAKNGRSITQEAEIRLENTFRDQSYVFQAFELAYGRGPAAILQIIARAMDNAGKHSIKLGLMDPAEWPKDPDAVENVKRALYIILSGFQPEDYVASEENLDPIRTGVSLGPAFARSILLSIKTAPEDSGGELEKWALPIRDQLGVDLTNQIRLPSLEAYTYDPSLLSDTLDRLRSLGELAEAKRPLGGRKP